MEIRRYSIDLSEQMAVCDANYIRILKLLPDLRLMENSYIKEIALPSVTDNGQGKVLMELVESFKYTSTVRISQKPLEPNKGCEGYIATEMLIRMYHDASTAEVISYQGHKNFKASYPIPNQNMYHADEKQQLNLFLEQWLKLCQEEGLHPIEKVSEKYLACLESE